MVKKTLAPTVHGAAGAIPSVHDFAARLEKHGEKWLLRPTVCCVLQRPCKLQLAACCDSHACHLDPL